MCLFQFLNQNAAAIQALTAVIVAGLTAWLIYWQRRYTQTSERVASIMEQDIEIRTTPYLRLRVGSSERLGSARLSIVAEILNDGTGTALVTSANIKVQCCTSGTELDYDIADMLPSMPFGVRPGTPIVVHGKASAASEGHGHIGDCIFELFGEVFYDDLLRTRTWKLVVTQKGKSTVEVLKHGKVIH